MKFTKKTAPLLILIFIVLFSSCGYVPQRITDIEVAPIQIIIDSLTNNDGNAYRKAFPAEYDALISADYEVSDCTNFSDYISKMLSEAQTANEDTYGKKVTVEFFIKEKIDIEMSKYSSYFTDYDDYHVSNYTLSPKNVEKAILVNGNLYTHGSKTDSTRDASYVLIKQNGVWYLHPIYYFLSFSG